jgi:acetylornithine/LysW-gamma-L-lysine aminotransferase
MITEKIIDLEKNHMAPIYWKRPIVIEHGKGIYLYDKNGKQYIDCTSNYGVAITGHNHPKVVKAIKEQVDKLMSCHGTFYNKSRSSFLEELTALTPETLDQAFLCNSGTEANEFAFKLARKSTGKSDIIAMMGGFHGKTLGSLSATWKKKYRESFMPLVPGFKHVPFGKIERLKDKISSNTAAVIIEPIQGESGINLPPDGYLKAVQDLCQDNNVLLIFDEIQTGMGRTGKFLSLEHWGLEPDILCLSKAVASGLPMGVTLSSKSVMSKLKIGDHSSTFGGGPVACAAATATIRVLLEEKLIENAASIGRYMLSQLQTLKKFRSIRDVRGLGLMLAIELRYDILGVLMRSIEEGVLFLDAGRNILRMLPPLIINKEHVNQIIKVLEHVVGEEEAAKLRG